mmetsp:Transcript_26503/g.58060  ORF Transcript_26503/g.58060 Transcript_26503/m.58060 type:complete len:162 (+) Transcript_26503:2-487(+)|eukprot:CAMPEP_0168310694 /NCGR_PEP_ID=MMETSP0142_2-20121227/66965_1 /TAXON_ID=44445 /ORGANISM="Pseudo-nitzschia australis, Strain 10249 10 AB" /LENGTH=161 /DNA_ID=CAMNT_0008263533 /DNA_START=979 /DNA_END=1464 /DNA_ORIENTATION=+
MYKAEGIGTSCIPKGLMMAAAQHAFPEAINKDKIQQINNSWELIKSKHVLKDKDLKGQYDKFKEHYTKHLKDWTKNMVDTEVDTGKAHMLVEYTNDIADMQETLQLVVANQNNLQDQYTAQSEVGYNVYHNPPSVVAATMSNNTANSVAPSTVYPDFESIL